MTATQQPPKALRWTYCLISAGPERLVFGLPLAKLFGVALLGLLLASVVWLHPDWFRGESSEMLKLAIIAGLTIFVGLLFVVSTHRGKLTIDAISRTVQLDFRAPRYRVSWTRPFDEFVEVRTRQIKDGHGLHNHWQIQLVGEDDVCLSIGYGLMGAVRRRSRDRLCEMLAPMMGIRIVHVGKE